MERHHRSASVVSTTIPAGTGDAVFRSLSHVLPRTSHRTHSVDIRDEESADDSAEEGSMKTKVVDDEWRLAANVKEIQLNDQAGKRHLGVTWKDLTVKVVPSDAMLQENALSQFNILQQVREARHKPALKPILDSSSGCVKPGEMLLVLGRPGSGCTTLLKMLANKRKG
jgi:ABC-type uncharacterized transport system fused permease/ATPase subunit